MAMATPELLEFANYQLPEDIVQPFAISASCDCFVVTSRETTNVLQLKFKHVNEDGAINFVLSRIRCSQDLPTGALVSNESSIYNSCDKEQRIRIMLDQNYFPNMASVFINNLLSLPSPPGAFDEDPTTCLVANLTTLGQLTVYRQDANGTDWNKFVNVTDLWIGKIYDYNPLETFEALEAMVKEIIITTFCWQDREQQRMLRLAFGNSSGKIVLVSLLASSMHIEQVIDAGELVKCLRWVTARDSTVFLFAGLRSGKVLLYRFSAHPSEPVGPVELIASLYEEDYLTTPVVECEVYDDSGRLLVLTVKGTHVLGSLCDFDGNLISSSVMDLDCFTITGVQRLENGTYMVSTLPGVIVLVRLCITPAEQLVIEKNVVKTDLNTGRYSIYGVTATENRTCWLLLGYPSKNFDHLALRYPVTVFFMKFNQRNALDMLLQNPMCTMTRMYDAAEVLRYDGNRNIDTLKPIEKLPVKIALDDGFAYYLKIQLVQLGSKISHYKKRNISIAEILHNQFQLLATMIEVIHACKVILYFGTVAHNDELSPRQLLSVRCLRNFIQGFADDHIPGDYEHLHVALRLDVLQVIEKTTDMKPMIEEPECCNFCDAIIDETQCTCPDEHPVLRCVLTKLQIPIGVVEYTCEMCHRYTLDPAILAQMFQPEGDTLSVNYGYCCVCDTRITCRVIR